MADSTFPVTARVERMNIPTYPALAPDPNPMFFANRNIQGAKGNIYPHAYIDRLSSEKVDRVYDAVVLENEYLQMILLPEIGGRIFAGLDKTNGYDFFYRHKVIKPALIGLFGPWISGGVEFNWPQHHRPTTYDPTHFTIEEHADGSKTVWMGEHDPLNRTKGMVGVCLHPGKALVETKARLYNRTPFPQSFMWWANAGVHINDHYQVIFPPDVHYAVYHVKNPVTPFPIAKGEFYGHDYGEGTDLSYWVNSPAASFFAAPSSYEFFGAYDHERGAGVVHVADAAVSPGKKFFTWGNEGYGHQWQRNLMDDTGEYLELMAGVYTDNQPDFSWIMPHETKTFSQFWYPVQDIGGFKNANLFGAVNLEVKNGRAQVGVYATERRDGARVMLIGDARVLLDVSVDLKPGKAFTTEAAVPAGMPESALLLRVQAADGQELIRYQVETPWDGAMAEPYKPPATPAETKEIEQLYLSGLHIEQYRHPTLSAEAYWEEALRRDPGESRCNVALGKGYLRRGLFALAEEHFRTAVKRLISWNFNPYDGEAHYSLGLALQYQDNLDEAYKAYSKAIWNYAWQSAGYYAMAQIDLLRGDLLKALAHLTEAQAVNGHSSKTRCLKAAVLRRSGEGMAAEALAAETCSLDRLDFWARYELALAASALGENALAEQRLEEFKRLVGNEVQVYLDLAFDYAAAGLYEDASGLLRLAAEIQPLYPLVAYTLGWLAEKMGEGEQAGAWYAQARQASPDYCFPWRLEELRVLQDVLARDPADARASYYLGNLLYDKRRYEEGVAAWQKAVEGEPGLSIPWRNLGMAAYNLDKDLDGAMAHYLNAMHAAPGDPRLLMEYDGLAKRKGMAPGERLALLESKRAVVDMRDDLVVALMSLYNRLGQPEKTLEITTRRIFHAWEGGEGSVAGQHANAHWILGKRALKAGDAQSALEHFELGAQFPENLGEHPWESVYSHLIYYQGLALAALKRDEESRAVFEKLAAGKDNPGPSALYTGLALEQLGRKEEGQAVLREIKRRAEEAAQKPFAWNYFYSGHPSPTFDDNQQQAHYYNHTLVAGLAAAALGEPDEARRALGEVLVWDPSNLAAWEVFRDL